MTLTFVQQPDPSTWNGNILGYLVQYRKQGMVDFQDKSLLYPEHTMELSNLEKYVEYEVQVVAFNSIGNGPHSIPTSVYVGVAGQLFCCSYIYDRQRTKQHSYVPVCRGSRSVVFLS